MATEIGNVASETEELIFFFHFISIDLNFKSHFLLLATALHSKYTGMHCFSHGDNYRKAWLLWVCVTKDSGQEMPWIPGWTWRRVTWKAS